MARAGVKSVIKRAVRLSIPTRIPPIIVVSPGRAGSALTVQSIVRGVAKQRFGIVTNLTTRLVSEPAFFPDRICFDRGTVYKSHAFPGEFEDQKPIFLFVFGSASDNVISVLSCKNRFGDEWLERHLRHLRSNKPIDEILDYDVLRIREQICEWTRCETKRVLCVKYHAIWARKEEISNFLGVSLKLPDFQPRTSQTWVKEEVKRDVRAGYRELDEEIDQMPEIFKPSAIPSN